MTTTRRTFLQAAGAASSLMLGGCRHICRSVVPRRTVSSQRIRIALFGLGGQGITHLRALRDEKDVEIVALCDVDEQILLASRAHLAQRTEHPHLYKDFRVLLESERALDAVFIATPDHSHAGQASWALQHGCHLYVEPPLTRTLGELRDLEPLIREQRAILQLGNQGSALPEFRRALACIQSGLLGEITRIDAWTNRPVWPQGIARPEGSDPIPDVLDWDLWLAGACKRPFKNKIYHPFNWRGWHDFGTGALGDIGCHLLNLPFRALSLNAPEEIQTEETTERFPETYARSSRVRFDFAKGKKHPPLSLYWHEGGFKPNDDLFPQITATFGRMPDVGCVLVGSKGIWFVADALGKDHYLAQIGEQKVCSMEKHTACTGLMTSLPPVKTQQREFLDALRSGVAPFSGLGHAIPLTTSILTGCVAQRVAGKLNWHDHQGHFENQSETYMLITPEVRKGWEPAQN